MYSLWAAKQRSKIILTFSFICLVCLGLYVNLSLYTPASCFDGKLNQDEYGVDCGGVCAKMCTSQVSPLITVWTRSYEVSDGLWSSFAYVENPNSRAYATEARYRFRLYDRSNTLIGEKEDTTFITNEMLVPVYANRIDTGGRVPYRTEFEWVEQPVWYQLRETYSVALEEQKIVNLATKPELTAVLVNKDPFPVEDVEVYAIVYDVNKNAVGVSKTYVDRVSARGKRNVFFVWNEPFSATPERWEVMARVPVQER